MADVDIKQMVAHNRRLIEDATKCIEGLQARCTHQGRHGTFRASIDPRDDIYFVDFCCPVCGKVWTEGPAETSCSDGIHRSKDGFVYGEVR